MEIMDLTMLPCENDVPRNSYDVNIIAYSTDQVGELIEDLVRMIDGCTEDIARDMLAHLPARIAHGVCAEDALCLTMLMEMVGAEVSTPCKGSWPDRTLM